jgi:hypothetical protein
MLAKLSVSREHRRVSMAAVNPPRKLPRLGSRIFKRNSLGDSVDGRSRECRFLLKCEAELLAQVRGLPLARP